MGILAALTAIRPRALRLALPTALAAAALTASQAGAAPRRVDYLWYDFFDAALVEDAWEQRSEVGFVDVRSFEHPVTHEATYVDGPRLFPGIAATRDLYAPARLQVTARNLPEINIDSIGGTRSPAAVPMGFLPYDLMGDLGAPPAGGTARVQARMQFIDRERANELHIPQQFGYHGWENEALVTLTLDRAAARKVLGIADADVAGIESWFAANEGELEQQWWWWLNDEGGDVHVGGAGRLDVRYAFNTPMQTWRVDFLSADYDAGADSVTLLLDWVAMASDILWSRWLREALQSPFESSAMSDMTLDMTIGPSSTDLDLDCAQDYALTQSGGKTRWTFEPSSADVPNLAVEYLNESQYQSPGLAYADKKYGRRGPGYDYVPAAWNLTERETLTFDFGDVAAKGQMTMEMLYMEPPPSEFPGAIHVDESSITLEGPMDLAAWSQSWRPESWASLADEAHPDGLLPYGVPYITFRAVPGASAKAAFARPKRPEKIARTDPERVVPPLPSPALEPTPPLAPGPGGRTVRYDFYDFLDVTMVEDRWEQYEHNDYVRIESLGFPVSYRSTEYFSSQEPDPFALLSSGVRMRITGRSLPEITIDSIGGGAQPAGFLPRNLLGDLEVGVSGGSAVFEGLMRYGTREREARYRLQEYWGYYGWENFLDARLSMDRAGARKILGITDADYADFASWWKDNEGAAETAWRLWMYEEWKRTDPMPWFNYPIQIWACDLTLVEADGAGIVLELTVLNEALDVVLGRWMTETFLPYFESSYDDMYFRMSLDESGADVDVDAVCDFALSGEDAGGGDTDWSWAPYFGDNPFLAYEYRAHTSPSLPYYGRLYHEGQADEAPYTETPTLWNLQAGEQLNLHFASSGLSLAEMEPSAAEFPGNIVVDPAGLVSLTGPLDLTAWSMSAYPAEWAALGGLLPSSAPAITLRQSP